MKQQFNLLISICFTLALFGCDSLRPAEEVREQQQDFDSRNCENLGSDWSFQRLQNSLIDLRSKELSKETPNVIFVYAQIVDQNNIVVPSSNAAAKFRFSAENAEFIVEAKNSKDPIKVSATLQDLDSV